MPLNLIHGPPNSGRAGLIRRRFSESLGRDPALVLPNRDDVLAFQRELCEAGAELGGSVYTFDGLFAAISATGGPPPGPNLTKTQRLRAVSLAISEQRAALNRLRRSAARPGFARAFDKLLDELQAAGLEPEAAGTAIGAMEGSAYLADIARLCAGYADMRSRLARIDSHWIARDAVALLRRSPGQWRGRPVYLYGFDDLTGNQLDLIEALAEVAEVTVALTYEEARPALAARAGLLPKLRARAGEAKETATRPDPANTPNELLFQIERSFGEPDPSQRPPADGLTILRSAGERGEAESVAAETAKLLARGVDPAEIAIVVRDPARRGRPIAAMLEAYGIGTALEAELPVAQTAVGGGLIALLEAEFGTGRASDLLRYLRGPSGASPGSVDWLEREVRLRRVQTAEAALELWDSKNRPLPDLLRIRKAAGSPAELAAEIGRLAVTMAARPLRGRGDGPPPEPGEELELRAAAAIAKAFGELAELGEPAPRQEELAHLLKELEFRAWSGLAEGRVRIAGPYQLRAARFDHVFVASLQDGEFPRREGGGDPFLSESQRAALGLEPRRDVDAEERYLFYACLSLPRRSIFLSYRDSDQDGAAETRSPFLDDVRRLLAPPKSEEKPEPTEESITMGRDLAQVVFPVVEAPSERELARAIAAHGRSADTAALLDAAAAGGTLRERIASRIESSRAAEAATRAPGPLTNPAVIESLAAVPAHGGTTLEQFDECSYRWFVGHELDPKPLDPVPDPLLQGSLIHAVLYRLYRERPGGDPLPRPASLGAWIELGGKLVAEVAAEKRLGRHPAERANVRRVERLLTRFLREEAKRDTRGFEPWLLEARFGEEGSDHPVLEIDGCRLHGAIDRVDRAADGHALVLDYKLAREVTTAKKLEEEAKLQLQLYLLAVAEHWGAQPVGALYHPLRGTSGRRPRGFVLSEAAGSLPSYDLYDNDLVDQEGFEEVLNEARRRAGEIVARMRRGAITRDPGPRSGLRGHNICPPYCEFCTICRRDRAPLEAAEVEAEEE